MNRLSELLRQLAYRLHGERNDAELEEEMRLHLELRAEQERARGMEPDAAAASARRRFGNATLLREQGRDAWGWGYLEGWLRDVSHAFRTLHKSPGFTATAVVSLALGIGANTAIFSLINALLLRELPVEDPRELVQITLDGGRQNQVTNPIWEAVHNHEDVFDGVLAFGTDQFDLAPRGESEPVDGMWVSGDFFRVLGVAPARGRLLTPEDDRRGGGPDGAVAVISHGLWQGRYGGEEDIVGRTILLDREPFTIIGVTPPWFTGLETDRSYGVAIPIGVEPLLHKDGSWLDRRSTWWLRVLARLSPDQSLEQAQSHLRSLSPGVFEVTLPTDWPDAMQLAYLKNELTVAPAATGFSSSGRTYKLALYALLGIAGLVLLIACANIANLLLARTAQRERELSMRMALGAGRARLVRRLLCESLLLALLGAAAGLALALVGSRFLAGLIRDQGRPILVDLDPDVRVLGFTVALAFLTAVLFGLTPALRATRIRLNDVLKEGVRGASQSSRRIWLGKAIVAGQVALSLVLLSGAGLFASTMRKLLREDLGFDPRGVLTVQLDMERAGVPKAQRRDVRERILERLRAAPEVVSAAESDLTPISGSTWNERVFPEGYTPQSRADGHMLFNRVSPGYFATMRTALLLGRDFDSRDVIGSPKVIIIDEASARRYWGAENPVGKTIRIAGPGREEPDPFLVIGVVQPIKYLRVTEDLESTGYLPAGQEESGVGRVHFVIRSPGSASALADVVREAVAAVNPEISIQFRELDAQVSESMTQQRLVATLSSVFAGLAIVLAVIGLYGVTSYSTARRRGEIGIRIALGAHPGSVVWLIVRDVAFVIAAGLAVGWAAALALGSTVESLLFGVEPGDPRLLGLAALILAGVSALAAYIPARQASQLQPSAVLREE